MQWLQWDSWLASILNDFGWVLIWIGRGEYSDVFLCIGDGWYEKTQDKYLIYNSLVHSGAMIDLNIGNVDANHTDHT